MLCRTKEVKNETSRTRWTKKEEEKGKLKNKKDMPLIIEAHAATTLKELKINSSNDPVYPTYCRSIKAGNH